MRAAILLLTFLLAGCPAKQEPVQETIPAAVDQSAEIGTGEKIELLPPRLDRGLPLMKALELRRTIRSYSDRTLSLQLLSDLLWAATGINRPDSGKLTAPTAVNYQEILVYVTLEQGAFLYDPRSHALTRILEGNFRDSTGVPPSMRNAPLNFVFVSDTSRMTRMSDQDKAFYSATDTGFVSQNVYLFCASEGLATVVRGAIDRDSIARVLGLGPEKKVILAQTVGYPAGE